MSYQIGFTARCYCKGGRIGLDREGFDTDATTACTACNGTDSQTSGFADELISVMADHPHLFRMALGLGTPMDKAIEAADRICRLEEGWDDDEGQVIQPRTLAKAAAFLRFAEYHDHEIPVPDINPVPDGSVDLEWHGDRLPASNPRVERYHILVNFPEDDKKGPMYSWRMGDEKAKGYVGFSVKYALKPLLAKDDA